MMRRATKHKGLVRIINSPAIRIILLKTVVGYERSVFKSFSDFLNANNTKYKIDDWWAYKIFGEYDICFIIKRPAFEMDLAYAGTIEGITYSTELLCYLWGQEGHDKLFEKQSFAKPLVFINILKLKPPCMRERDIDIEHTISQLLKHSVFCLGSFGWNEFVTMYPADRIDELHDNFQATTLTHALYSRNRGPVGLFLKPFVMIGVNYQLLYPDIDCSQLDDQKINQSIFPSVSVSCRPSDIVNLQKAFVKAMKSRGKEIEPRLTFGTFDFTMQVKGITWGQFIDRLIRFREARKASIFKTSVQISEDASVTPELPSNFMKLWKFDPMCVKVLPDHIEKLELLGHPVQESILATIYTFNQYLQNELLADCVEDMLDYVANGIFLLEQLDAENPSSLNEELLQHIENLPENIKYGCNQRLSGFLLQEGAEDFSAFKGGKQRLLKALKAVCKDMFEGLGKQWYGYVTIGKQYYYHHAYGVISIPVNAAFDVSEYWGLFHEMCHVMLLTEDPFNESFETETEKKLLKEIGRIGREIFCDIFDYECGFLGDYDLYRSTVPAYLSRHRKSLPEIEGYILRFVCVTCYHKAKDRKSFIIKDNELLSICGEVTEQFIKLSGMPVEYKFHLVNSIVNTYDKMRYVLESYKEFHGQQFEKFFIDRRRKLKSKGFQALVNKILEGQIVPIDHPQLVVLSLLKRQQHGMTIPFNSNAAAIQSFLNCYYDHDWDKTYFPYVVKEQ
jgi:hypothetical protein